MYLHLKELHQNKQDNQPKEGEEESNPNEPIEQQNPVESKPGEPVPQQPGQEEKQPENESEPKEKKKIRCKNWPHCTDKNCIYTHPTTTVIKYIFLFLVSIFPKLYVWR